ncbi:3-deoxy-D-manno-octulosonic acid transferase [Histidinibacterium aquaticum]|uniref:3-deoxy-D-manno-octulosonic acid transferase n=1 Tax=Histidinibacterium aquaticum TaxID=2613962 RepID=A0A5J5GPH0_9RHOB|nr:glycosyltransferase N-terminal domain-containing protein [Histidinibacterium aquaticum]KAA9010191.1 3-deoxy-D-manno-octulosonic acid transferase [Histidinibacterium aquaticum]
MILYRLLLSIAVPVLISRLLWRRLRREDGPGSLSARLKGPDPEPGALWIHGASNGELASARPLAAALAARTGRPLLVTANTATGRTLAEGWDIPRTQATLAPLDFRASLRRPLSRVSGLLLLENEIWPNRIILAAARGLPVLMVGARISERSAARWARLPGLARRILSSVTLLSPQDAESGARFRALGLPADRLIAPVQLKSLYIPPDQPPPEELRTAFPRARTLLAASTHEGEEETVLDAFARLHAENPGLKLILAPRHPRRAEAIARLASERGLRTARRSAADAPDGPVYLADTMGEMAHWYALAGCAFVGGSLVPKGGHTPYEPAVHGCAILHGPHLANFADEYARLDTEGGALQVEDAAGLAEAWQLHLETSPMPDKARAVLAPGNASELLDRIVEVLSR